LLIDPDPVINLEGADLRGADLVNAPLSHKTKYFLLLEGDLRGAKFDHTTLRGQFQGNLKGASFKGARLEAAVFVADLRGASFKGATLLGANLACNKLDGAVFDDAFILAQGGRAQDGRVTTFQDADLDNASFVGATFNPSTIFLGAHGQHVDFSNAVNLSSPIRPPPKGYFSSCRSLR
jgi:uncharacterized protein YjbI with pentapeptide repeats